MSCVVSASLEAKNGLLDSVHGRAKFTASGFVSSQSVEWMGSRISPRSSMSNCSMGRYFPSLRKEAKYAISRKRLANKWNALAGMDSAVVPSPRCKSLMMTSMTALLGSLKANVLLLIIVRITYLTIKLMQKNEKHEKLSLI